MKRSFCFADTSLEQHMIESLAEHGVQAEDLVPALMTTHSVRNPEYDPRAAKEAEREREKLEQFGNEDMVSEAPPPPYEPREVLPDMPATTTSSEREDQDKEVQDSTPTRSTSDLPDLSTRSRSINPFGSDDEDDELSAPRASTSIVSKPTSSSSSRSLASPPLKSRSTNPFGDDDEDEDMVSSFASASRSSVSVSGDEMKTARPSSSRLPSFDMDDDDGDIGRPASPPPKTQVPEAETVPLPDSADVGLVTEQAAISDIDPERTPTTTHMPLPESRSEVEQPDNKENMETGDDDDNEKPAPLPSLPGVSTSLTSADENVILDIRLTVVRRLSSLHACHID